jgi:hypothetical protein
MDTGFEGEDDLANENFGFDYSSDLRFSVFPTDETGSESPVLTFSQGYDQPLTSPGVEWRLGQEPSAFPALSHPDYFGLPVLDTWDPVPLSSPILDESPRTDRQSRTQSSMLRPRPSLAFHSRSQSSPILPAPPVGFNRQLSGNGRQSRIRGRNNPLQADARRDAARTRKITSCVYHKVKRTKVGTRRSPSLLLAHAVSVIQRRKAKIATPASRMVDSATDLRVLIA